MPMFDYECPKCGHIEQDHLVAKWEDEVVCPCGGGMKRMPTAGVPHMFPDEGVFLENVSPEGKLFH
ncbi:hypothetical protein LCGC14_1546950, partial [marine sediment metagenome]